MSSGLIDPFIIMKLFLTLVIFFDVYFVLTISLDHGSKSALKFLIPPSFA